MHPEVLQNDPQGGCPICGMDLTPLAAPQAKGTAGGAEAEGLWTCGMHPEVIQESPDGGCPICGMDLTPMKAPPEAGASSATGAQRKIKYWVAPMDPSYIRDGPGKSPMGMDLVPVYEDEAANGPAVFIEPGIIQAMGVRLERVERRTVFRHLRTIGEVEVGEDELSVVNLRFSGWVERIRVDKTGDPVRRGQVLFDIYSPDVVAAQEEYLLAITTQGASSPLARSARKKLDLWDIDPHDIEAIVEAGSASRTVPIRAPQKGFVLHKNVMVGARVTAGSDLYRIGNLQRIWVTAEVYEFDAPWVEVGQRAQAELSYQRGKVLEGKVSYIYPTLNPKTRTLSVRLEFDNPGVRLKPGMFATVYIEFRRKDEVLAIPSEAVMHSGRREIVFVTQGDGHFTPKEIVSGLVGDRHMTEVLHGLEEGELVVASGQFLIDSESQLQEAIQKLLARRMGSATEAPSPPTALWSCPMHPEVISDHKADCPECGMFLEERRGTPEELSRVFGAASGDHAGPAHGDPDAAGQEAAAPVAQPGQYTCPMHPAVVSDEAGSCPDCGMFLERVPEPAP
jgi:Cu(I)/Ag(I) efflux system membrane fusion protein/cobalt-zinc-cadmium efflux system membrane fusion protein